MIPCEDFSGDGRLQILSVHFSSPTNKRHIYWERGLYDQIMHESSYIVARDSSGNVNALPTAKHTLWPHSTKYKTPALLAVHASNKERVETLRPHQC